MNQKKSDSSLRQMGKIIMLEAATYMEALGVGLGELPELELQVWAAVDKSSVKLHEHLLHRR